MPRKPKSRLTLVQEPTRKPDPRAGWVNSGDPVLVFRSAHTLGIVRTTPRRHTRLVHEVRQTRLMDAAQTLLDKDEITATVKDTKTHGLIQVVSLEEIASFTGCRLVVDVTCPKNPGSALHTWINAAPGRLRLDVSSWPSSGFPELLDRFHRPIPTRMPQFKKNYGMDAVYAALASAHIRNEGRDDTFNLYEIGEFADVTFKQARKICRIWMSRKKIEEVGRTHPARFRLVGPSRTFPSAQSLPFVEPAPELVPVEASEPEHTPEVLPMSNVSLNAPVAVAQAATSSTPAPQYPPVFTAPVVEDPPEVLDAISTLVAYLRRRGRAKATLHDDGRFCLASPPNLPLATPRIEEG